MLQLHVGNDWFDFCSGTLVRSDVVPLHRLPAVGYGTDTFITGGAASPKAITIFDGIRSYRQVSSIPAQDAFPDRFLKITAGVCFGDSGGPLFHGDTIVALNTWTAPGRGSQYRTRCRTACRKTTAEASRGLAVWRNHRDGRIRTAGLLLPKQAR